MDTVCQKMFFYKYPGNTKTYISQTRGTEYEKRGTPSALGHNKQWRCGYEIREVDMTNKSVRVENVPDQYVGLGGSGLTSIMINSEVPPTCDPLGPENKLVIAPGSLSGTPLVNTSRISIGAKSPLTGTIKESNAGGTVADALGRLGITAIIVEGKAPEATSPRE